MAKKAFVSLTGGLNNVDRPDTLEEDQLQECVNYEITGVGKLEKRTDPSQYSEDLTAGLQDIFTEILFVSEPYYPPNKLKGDYEDFMLFVYGVKEETDTFSLEIAIPGTVIEQVWTGKYRYVREFGRRRRYKVYEDVSSYKWTFKNQSNLSYMEELYEAGLVYTDKSNIDISIGDRNAYINDGVNPIHKVTITPRGELVASFAGLKAPKNKPRISLKELNQQYDSKESAINYTSDVTGATLGSIGLLQVQYTVVMATGEESNPSPMSDWANGQFFKIAEDGVSDERLIKSITVYDLNLPNIPANVQKDLKYFKIYYRIVRYSEGVELDSMEFSVQEEIKVKTTQATFKDDEPRNSYTITAVKSVGDVISYENDAGLPCKVSAVNAGIVMIGGVTKTAAIPASFQYMTPITIRNTNNVNYVDAVVQIELETDDMVDDDGNTIFDNWSYYFHPDSEYMSGEQGIRWKSPGGQNDSIDQDYYSRHLRIYDTDMTTPIMVFVPFTYNTKKSEDNVSVGHMTIYVKIPLLIASADHTVYFCWNKINGNFRASTTENPYLLSGHTGVEDDYNSVTTADNVEESFTWENNIGIHYGRWCLSSDLTNVAQARQQVFSPRKVPSGSTEILTAPNVGDLGLGDSENGIYDLPNRANLNNNGEATSIDDPLIIQNSVQPPTGCPIQITKVKYEDGDTLPEGKVVGDDKTYEFGGEWTPATEEKIEYHYSSAANYNATGSRVNRKHKSTDEHYNEPPHNAYSDKDGYYINYDDNDNELPLSHTHTIPASNGEWKATEEKPLFNIQTYKYDVGKTETGTDNIIGTTKGMSPISTLDSTGERLDDYSLLNELSWKEEGSFPSGLDKLYRIPGVFNQPLPVLQRSSESVDSEYDGSGQKRQNYYSVGSFKPWCGGWSFRKQALSMGTMPDKGYFYTTLTFRKDDLADGNESGKGISPGGTVWNSYDPSFSKLNTIFYISCGAINDVDATPNYPMEFVDDHYLSSAELGASEWEKTDSVYADNIYVTQDLLDSETGRSTSPLSFLQPRTRGYNRDNFKAVSIAGLSPGDLERKFVTLQDGGKGIPTWNAGAIQDRAWSSSQLRGSLVVDEHDPELDLDPTRNMIVVRLTKGIQETYFPQGRIGLVVDIGRQTPKSNYKRIMFALDPVDSQDYVSIFVYFSWDIIDEKIALGWSLVDDETDDIFGDFNKNKNNHYGSIKLMEWDLTSPSNGVKDFKNRFQNKVLYDIGLGNSTYINRVSSGTTPPHEQSAIRRTQSGYHGFYGATELTVNDYITNKNQILAMRNGTPRFENPVGVNWEDYSQNNNISFAATKNRTDKTYDNMIMWSELGRDGFPDLNYKLLKEPVINIFSAPSFLKFEYSNTFLIFTRNTINRFVLKGTATGWAGSSESLIEEQLQFGLFAPKSLVNIGAEMVWFSEEGVIRWSSEGMQNISGNVIDIPLNGNYLGFYCPMGNQYILHDNDTYISYAYDMTYRMWTTFKGMNILSSSILSRGSASENVNLLLNGSDRTIYKYPGEQYTTEDAHIKTMDLFMDSGQIKRVKVAYNGDSAANLIYNLAYNNKDSINREESTRIDAIQKNTWRGLGDLGRIYGRVANFEIENADEIATIIYDAFTRGE